MVSYKLPVKCTKHMFPRKNKCHYKESWIVSCKKCAFGAYANIKGQDQTAHMRSLIWALAVSLQVTGYTVQYNGTIKALISVYSLADWNLHCSQINLMKKAFSQGSSQLLWYCSYLKHCFLHCHIFSKLLKMHVRNRLSFQHIRQHAW